MRPKRTTKSLAKDEAVRFYEALSKELLPQDGVTTKTQFGSAALLIGGKVFTFPWKGNLVFKLPEDRVAEIVAAKQGELFDAGHGRTSKTWVAVYPKAKRGWRELGREAKSFVDSQKR